MWLLMNMWSRSTYKRLRKRSNSFPVHKKLVWPTDLPKSEEEIFNSSQPRVLGICVSQLCVAIDPDLISGQNVHCNICWRIKSLIESLWKLCQFDFVFKIYLNKGCTNDIFINIFVCFEVWSVLIKELWLLLMSSFRLQVSPSAIGFWNLD
jgi:hypothetical protein